ncbi:hypothetical protein VPJG_00023 [Vibrio phage jenny 12G5]|nr:hypothetical protein VPJG_00023 [Vibrio phage jenny 12G5]
MIVQDPLNPTADADSMVSVEDARLRAVSLGVALPADDTECEVALVKGNVYLNSLCFYGEPVVPFQQTCFPRKDISINNNEYPDDQIPQQAIDAQIVSAAYAATDDIYTVVDNDKRVSSEKVDVLQVTYAVSDSGSYTGKKKITRAEELLSMFLCSDSNYWAYLG